MLSLPEVAFVPLHEPEAVHDVALVEDQVSVEVPFTLTDVGEAEIVAVGAGGGGGGVVVTFTVTERPTVPPPPVQFRL